MKNFFFTRSSVFPPYGILAVILLALAACAPKTSSQSLRYAEFKVVFSAQSHLAAATGETKRQGLAFTSISVPAGPDVIAALRSTASSGAHAGNLANEPVAAMIGAGDHPIIVAALLSSSHAVRLVTFERTGVTEDVHSLQGKRIGVVLDTVGESYLVSLLKTAGMNMSDVRIVNGRPAELRAALIRGDLDAAILWDPFIAQTSRIYESQRSASATADRGPTRVLLNPAAFTSRIYVVSTAEHLQEQRGNLQKLLRALVVTEAYIRDNKAEAQANVEQWLGLEAGDLTDFFATTTFRVDLDLQAIQSDLRAVLERLHAKQDSTESPTDLAPYIDASLLRELDASRVR